MTADIAVFKEKARKSGGGVAGEQEFRAALAEAPYELDLTQWVMPRGVNKDYHSKMRGYYWSRRRIQHREK